MLRSKNMEYIALLGGILLILIGMWGMLTKQNIIRIIIGFSLFDTGLHIVIVSLGYIRGRTAPIINSAVSPQSAVSKVVDPVPQAIVLTAIVIGFAVTALMLTFSIKLFKEKKTLNIRKLKEQK
jgi:multisubunit Na+/H+ antiporter MnhC subunit